jgi:NAD-dependent dihydropyrimidine dehydrogenase PreA subunit
VSPVGDEKRSAMTYVVTEACLDVLDRTCLEDCPVDCIYQGDRKMYINPVECIDCGACEQACPVEAAIPARLLLGGSGEWHIADNAAFFARPLPGRPTALGTPHGASRLGCVGVDTEGVAALAPGGQQPRAANRPSPGLELES